MAKRKKLNQLKKSSLKSKARKRGYAVEGLTKKQLLKKLQH